MKHILRSLSGSAAVVAIFALTSAAPVSAQKSGPPAGGGGDKASAPAPSAPSGGSGGSTASAPAPSGGSGGYSGGAVSKGGGGGGGGERHGGATGAAGYTAPHVGRTSDNGGHGSTGSPTATSAPRAERGGRTGEATGRTNNTPGSATGGVPAYSRPRDGNEPVGTAVPRGTTPHPPNGGSIWVPGGYYGGYYPGYYGGGYYDPGYYGGYYGGFYDPWYGGYPADVQATYTPSTEEGSLRLKIKPRDAEVYVDGYFVGIVDDFDGIFQRLHLDSGAHRIEVRATGYETLDFDVRITPDHTTTYQGELKKIQ